MSRPMIPLATKIMRNSTPEPNSGCLLWAGSYDKDGYGKTSVNGKTLRAHRAAWICENGEIPEGLFVCHKCDNPSCVNTAHLFLGSAKDNLKDMSDKGRDKKARGEHQGFAKLTESEILEIRMVNMPIRNLAEIYNISYSNVSAIKTRRSWSHL